MQTRCSKNRIPISLHISTLVVLASSENDDASILCAISDEFGYTFAFAFLRVKSRTVCIL